MIITDVILPTTIVDQMAAKTMVISQNAAQKMNQVTLPRNSSARNSSARNSSAPQFF